MGSDVPDVRSPEFPRLAHLQSLVLARSDQEGEDQAFVDAISCDWDALDED